MLPIKCGLPNIKSKSSGNPQSASFTKFILPFAYSIINYHKKTPEICYEQYKGESFDDYFSKETADVIYKKAQRFKITKWCNDTQVLDFLRSIYNYNNVTKIETNGKIYPGILCEFGTPDDNGDIKEKRPLRVCLAPPELVLYEWPQNPRCGQTGDLLQTGFLVLELFFPRMETETVTMADLLRLNEIFRYFKKPYAKHIEGYKTFMPLKEGKEYLEHWRAFLEVPIKMGKNRIYNIIPLDDKSDSEDAWNIYADQRAFVWSCAMVPEKSSAIETYRQDFWPQFLNVDLPGREVSEFEKHWAEERTYQRWRESGSFYGFNYHSGVLLAQDSNGPPICRHFQTLYLDMILLLLYIRLELFRFSHRLAKISKHLRSENKGDITEWREKFREIQQLFVYFTNCYQYPLISNHQQAIEMYNQARKRMDIDNFYKEIQNEIDDSYSFIESETTSKLNIDIAKLTLIAVLVGILSVLGVLLTLISTPEIGEAYVAIYIFSIIGIVVFWIKHNKDQ